MSARRSFAIPPSERRGLNREQAADYVGVSIGMFDAMVADRRMPPAKRINTRLVWDRVKLDEAFSAIPDGDNEPDGNPVDAALAEYEARLAQARPAVSHRGRRSMG